MFLGAESSISLINKKNIIVKNLKNNENFKYILNQIHLGKIVVIFSGKSEFGPRALGNRSIIFSPYDKKLNDLMSF